MAVTKRRSRTPPRTRGGAGCLLWLVGICLVVVLVFANMGKIRQTLANTKFLEILTTKGGQLPSAPVTAPVVPAPKVEEEPSRKAPSKPDDTRDAVTVSPGEEPGSAENSPAPSAKRTESVPEKPASAPTRAASLYFVRVDGDGVIVRQEVKRSIPATDSPLTDALESLLKGPGEDELRKELITLIPQGTRLLSAQVRGTTAFLNFSEPFMYNSYGIEGYAGQLKQVVWTATVFPTVQDVQILVEGQRREYLGGEGVYIGRPLSRNSF